MITISAPGKIHLSGEHSVVYGKPAFLAPVDIQTRITAKLLKTPTIKYKDAPTGQKTEWDFSEIQKCAVAAKKNWNLFLETKNIAYLKNIKTDPWALQKIAIGETYQFLGKKPKTGFSLTLHSNLPTGSGMGSSAATSAALVGTIFCLEQEKWNLETINQIVYEVEKRGHGFPSGGDNSTIVHGNLLQFQNINGIQTIKKIITPQHIPNFIFIQSGKPVETTGEIVSNVHAKHNAEKETFETIFSKIEEITEQIIKTFETSTFENLNALIKKNQKLLEKIGVVGKKAKTIIQFIESIGGAAKVCGAGGIKNGSGIIVAFHPQIQTLENALIKQNIPFFYAPIVNKGLICENM